MKSRPNNGRESAYLYFRTWVCELLDVGSSTWKVQCCTVEAIIVVPQHLIDEFPISLTQDKPERLTHLAALRKFLQSREIRKMVIALLTR